MDIAITNIEFDRIMNIFTAIFLDLAPKINATIKPISIKKYMLMGIHRLIFGNNRPMNKTNKEKMNNTIVRMIG